MAAISYEAWKTPQSPQAPATLRRNLAPLVMVSCRRAGDMRKFIRTMSRLRAALRIGDAERVQKENVKRNVV